MPIEYSFTTRWKTKAPIHEVWEAIRLSLDWPQWWKSFESVIELQPGDEMGIGSVRRYTLQSPTRYKLSFDLLLTDRIEHKLLKGRASGELAGTGTWTFEEKDGMTYVQCLWNVSTTKSWMNTLAFLLKPAFKYNHRLVMKKGAKYLAQRLGVEVRDIS
jgi:hypothetical protein